MNESAWMINRLNLKSLKIPYIITLAIFCLCMAQDIIKIITLAGKEQYVVSTGDYLWVLIPFAAIYIAAMNFRRVVNLGGKRKSFFKGSFVTYLVLSGAVSFMCTLVYYTYDRFIIKNAFEGVFFLADVFGWSTHGPVAVFFQQFAFLFLLAIVTHTLTAMQYSWIGWAADALIAAILAVFIPIAPLRAVLAWFFNLIIFHPSALLQILVCLVLGMAIYALNLPIFNRRTI